MNEKKSRLEVNINIFFLDLHFPERPQKLNQTPNMIIRYVSKFDISYTKFVPSLKPIYNSKILITVRPRTTQLARQCALEIYHTNWIFLNCVKNALNEIHFKLSRLEIEKKVETPIFYFFFQTFTSLCSYLVGT